MRRLPQIGNSPFKFTLFQPEGISTPSYPSFFLSFLFFSTLRSTLPPYNVATFNLSHIRNCSRWLPKVKETHCVHLGSLQSGKPTEAYPLDLGIRPGCQCGMVEAISWIIARWVALSLTHTVGALPILQAKCLLAPQIALLTNVPTLASLRNDPREPP